jgi:CRISPR-associated protein Cas1
MPYRNIFIANTAKLTTKNEQLVVDNGESFSFPIEDIRCVLIEDYRSTITTALLSKFAEAGVTVLICNGKHLPTAALNPINCYSRQLKQIKSQIEQSTPSKKRMWQQITSSKIANQARCLKILEKPEAEKLFNYSKSVKSGDPENVEGRATAVYFQALFGESFKRHNEDILNGRIELRLCHYQSNYISYFVFIRF